MKKKDDINKLRQILGGNFSSFKFNKEGNWYNQPKEKNFPLRLFDGGGYIDIDNDYLLKQLDGYSQSNNSFHINKGGISQIEGYKPLPPDSDEIHKILGSQNKKGE